MHEGKIAIRLGPANLILQYPQELDEEIWPYFSHFSGLPENQPATILRLSPTGADEFSLSNNGRLVWRGLSWPGALLPILDEIGRVVAAISTRPILRAAAIRGDGRAVLIAGPRGCGKTGLAGWFVHHGFEYLADDLVSIHGPDGTLSAAALPLCPHGALSPMLLSWPSFVRGYTALGSSGAILRTEPVRDHEERQDCGLVVIPTFHEGSPLIIEPVAAEKLRFYLELAAHPDQMLSGAATETLADFCRQVPAVTVRFGHHDQLAGILDHFVHYVLKARLNAAGVVQLVRTMPNPLQQQPATAGSQQINEESFAQPAVVQPRRRLTIGMATYDDYDGVYFTLQALRLYHQEVADDIEYIVVDNNPDGICGQALRKLGKNIPGVRYVPIAANIGTAVRDFVMQNASSDFVMCLDCHVLVMPGAVARLMHYFDEHPRSDDLLQGPLLNDSLTALSTHWRTTWQQGMYGAWALDEAGCSADNPPFDIPMQGLGLYACRRAAWPGYNRHFRGFGGEEGYIHEKFRRAGGRTLCLPFLRWLHRFDRPAGTPYRISWHDRIRNYMLGFDELGLPMEDMLAHFRSHLGAAAEPIIEQTRQELHRMKQAGALPSRPQAVD